ncbi:acyl-ACP desaturase [Nocardia sp. NBC_00508]|uniref:acyl-ACP desaturase n=1 Tax=Nocardia sp. NBC_00508 TaxID=2975992 RepID=UPI002E80D2A3|nr:acyl-ACP desaturase [Nocardia sp. NBC_00508]WUD66857.1 acyl-ACP desaturase [Nocardia sp. NBC_00508]
MTTALSDRYIPRELESAIERLLNDHLHKPEAWNPHDYLLGDNGRSFAALAIDRDYGRSEISDVTQISMITNLRSENNLPSYHREISKSCTLDGVWDTRLSRWALDEHEIRARRFDEQRERAAARQAERAAAVR